MFAAMIDSKHENLQTKTFFEFRQHQNWLVLLFMNLILRDQSLEIKKMGREASICAEGFFSLLTRTYAQLRWLLGQRRMTAFIVCSVLHLLFTLPFQVEVSSGSMEDLFLCKRVLGVESNRSWLCHNLDLSYVQEVVPTESAFLRNQNKISGLEIKLGGCVPLFGVYWGKTHTLVTIESRWHWHIIRGGVSASDGRSDCLLPLNENSWNAVPQKKFVRTYQKFSCVTTNQLRGTRAGDCSQRQKIVWRTSSVILRGLRIE